ncbi:DUF3592 domain-containing protein [Sphingosinicella sp. YJ22]|uniref:DUF3592 domain-containing protein n=1 Tax=Sphingosinicella sp. YJ22 TaxID=1104780 RepID=UPI00140DAC14|nr:DUF3592 domain-containing protein [Sphingosinicella sp. YJ22]
MARKADERPADSARARRIVFLMIGAPFMIAALVWYVWAAWTEGAARDWPTTAGQVVETSVATVSGRTTAYAPVVRYRFEVNGTIYRNSKILLTDHPNFDAASEAEAYAAAYPVGSQVSVHYDPANPQRAALSVTSDRTAIYILAAVGLLIACLGLIPQRWARQWGL